MIRIGIVGCGRILAAHLRGFRYLREAGIDTFRITALCPRKADDGWMYVKRGEGPPQRPPCSDIPGDPLAVGDEYLSDFQNDVDVQVYTDYRQMIAEGAVDAICDFSTHALHHQVAEASFAHGKHLLSQKPLAVSMAAGRRMCESADARELTFAVFENFRHAPRTRQLHWLFNGGPGGALQMILLGYVGVWWSPDLVVAQTPWRHVLDEAGGISLDLGVHFFDQIRHVAGEIRTVSGSTQVLEPRRHIRDAAGNTVETITCDADDTYFANFTTDRGVSGNMFASWGGHGAPTLSGEGMVYYGSSCSTTGDQVKLDGRPGQSLTDLYNHSHLPERETQFPRGITDSFALSQLDWLEAIRLKRRPETDGWEGLRDLAAAFAILESAKLGRSVDVAEVFDGKLREYQRPIDARFGLK
jgi:predicted dehydrogenase